MNTPLILAVSCSADHTFTKKKQDSIELIAGHGVKGDAHAGETVKHRSRVRKDPSQPNLRQVHLIHQELYDELTEKNFNVFPGCLGENITTSGIDILHLPQNTILHLGGQAQIKITGLRNPCSQLNEFQDGLMKAVLDKDEEGNLIRRSGIMSVVLKSGEVKAGDPIRIEWPDKPHLPLQPV